MKLLLVEEGANSRFDELKAAANQKAADYHRGTGFEGRLGNGKCHQPSVRS